MVLYNVASLIATATILPLLSVVAVCLRFYVRLHVAPTYLGIDDYLITIASVLVCGQGANQIVAAVVGELGRDNQPVMDSRLTREAKIDFATLIFEKFTYTTIKLSVLFFYRRIFISQKTFRVANNILIILITLWGIAFLFAQIFLCGVNSHLGGHSNCPRQNYVSVAFAITDVIGDAAVLSLPYPCIRKLQMSKQRKVGLCAIFLLGTISLIAGIVRLGFVSQNLYLNLHPKETNTSPDRTPPSFWTTIEVSLGVLAACLPPLGPLLKVAPSSLSSFCRSLLLLPRHDPAESPSYEHIDEFSLPALSQKVERRS